MIIYTDFDMLLYGMTIILLFITALQYLGMARKKEIPHEKLINRAYGILFICLTFQFSLFVFYILSLEGYTIDHSYWGNIELENISLLSEWLYRGSWIPFYTYTAIFINAVEKIRNKKILIGRVLGIISILLIIFLPFNMIFTLGVIPFVIMAFLYIHVLFTLMKWAKKDLKAATSFIILGSVLIGSSIIYSNPLFMMAEMMPSIFLPLSLIAGTILCVTPTFMNPKFFLRSMNYWYVFCISVIGYYVSMSIYIGFFAPEYFILAFALLITYILECLFFLKSLLKEKRVSTDENVGVIGVFTRRETITEEEVSVSKEKKVCLVCKGKIARANYICPDCNAFYCEKCSKALSNMENACWACNASIDLLKPSKSFELENEEVVVDEGILKKLGSDENDESYN